MDDLLAAARCYPVTILPDSDEVFIAQIPDFPQVYTNGDSPQEALTNAYEAIALALEWYAERGLEPPTPSLPARAA